MADVMSILWFVIIGGVAGWLASKLINGRGFGVIGDILIGVIGAVISGWIFGGTIGTLGTLVYAFIGAVILLAITKLIRKI